MQERHNAFGSVQIAKYWEATATTQVHMLLGFAPVFEWRCLLAIRVAHWGSFWWLSILSSDIWKVATSMCSFFDLELISVFDLHSHGFCVQPHGAHYCTCTGTTEFL